MATITTKDRTQIYYKDWGTGQPVVFSHGWPMSANAWEDQMIFLASHGYRCIAHDRRGHGCSSQPWKGNEMDTYADDVATLIKTHQVSRSPVPILCLVDKLVGQADSSWVPTTPTAATTDEICRILT